MDNMTPMLSQYNSIKSRYADCILFFRLGDFYEMFFEDAKTASSILNVVLTSRNAGKSGKAPMCGIPYHAADSYIAKLIKAGRKVAICEQTEDPALATGIVKRDVVRVITTGTFIDENSSDTRYMLSVSADKKNTGLAFTDTINGAIHTNEYADINKMIEVISRLPAYECIFPQAEEEKIKRIFNHPLIRTRNISLSPYQDWAFGPEAARKSLCEHFATHNLRGFGIEELTQAIASSGGLLEYLKQMNKRPMRHISKISLYSDTDHVFISPAACYGLEIDDFIKTIDNTLTGQGKRKLHYWIYHPLKDKTAILTRQNAVTLLKENPQIQQQLSMLLRHMPDIEKSLSRISCGYTQAKDLLTLRSGLTLLPEIQKTTAVLSEKNHLFAVNDLPQIRKLLETAINPDTPLSNPQGKIIRKGFNQELDTLQNMQENTRQMLKNMQKQEIEKTGINSLKIGFTKVFGYYIEISKANLHLVPPEYIRKQTLVGGERYVTPELKDFEEKMLTAEEKILHIETALLGEIQKEILDYSQDLHEYSQTTATLDVLYSLSVLASLTGYSAPQITENREIIIKNGRHPVVEKKCDTAFIPNDTLLDCDDNHLLIITGPNMAGKSTYIRQTALLVILAQTGSYIPSDSAQIGMVDKIFTRIGAHDEISKGHSTFMVEMSETAGILNNLSAASLVIMDEVGRGTSTYDGFSLAWAVAEYLQKNKVRTLFATHFHELTGLAEEHRGVKNYNIAVKEWRGEIVFLHKIIPGGTDDSYGIYVAKLAGIPKEVVERSKAILKHLEIHGNLKERLRRQPAIENQLDLFSDNTDNKAEEIKKDIRSLDINSVTPLEALNKIQEWKKSLE